MHTLNIIKYPFAIFSCSYDLSRVTVVRQITAEVLAIVSLQDSIVSAAPSMLIIIELSSWGCASTCSQLAGLLLTVHVSSTGYFAFVGVNVASAHDRQDQPFSQSFD